MSTSHLNKLLQTQYLYLGICIVIALLKTNTIKAEEFELWTFVGVETELENISVSLLSANYFVPEDYWFLNFTQLSLDFSLNKKFNAGIGYKQIYVKEIESFRKEYRPMLHLTYVKTWGNIEFANRNRLEFRFMNKEMINRYRSRLKFCFIKFEAFVPYFSSEFFFYFNKLDYVSQRTILGAVVPMKDIDLNLFIGHQISKYYSNSWTDKIMIGTSLVYNF